MAAPWIPDFALYHSWAGDDVVFVTVDDAAAGSTGAVTHQVMVRVEIPLMAPGRDGLPTAAERPAVDRAEHAIAAQLERDHDAWFVGRHTSAGTTALTFYIANESLRGRALFSGGPVDRTPDLLGPPAAHAPYAVRHWAAVDPDWKGYELLRPTGLQRLIADSNRRGREMRRAGDLAGVPREIDHVALFGAAEAAEAAATELTAAGFTITSTNAAASGDVALEFRRTDARRGVDVEAFLTQILAAIELHGGRYDGWVSPVVKTGERATRS